MVHRTHWTTEALWASQYQLPGCHGDDGVAELGSDVGHRVSLQQGAQRGSGVGEELCYICSRASTTALKKILNQENSCSQHIQSLRTDNILVRLYCVQQDHKTNISSISTYSCCIHAVDLLLVWDLENLFLFFIEFYDLWCPSAHP